MKMIVAIISNDDANRVQKVFVENGLIATRLSTTSGFLRARNATFLLGVEDDLVDSTLNLIEQYTKKRKAIVPNTIVNEFGAFSSLPIEVEVGGATCFIIDIEKYKKF